ncbi:hypothetical protein [Paludisphaera rhizosphaerae]|uniref:hypothetical protein n=1 Tax=Paludisphaera rhizosphaerae TaxID=2711216 RepID=UPI0013E9E0F1|nr:hypothetical protein [Paludisphaera rhizosphaerae]
MVSPSSNSIPAPSLDEPTAGRVATLSGTGEPLRAGVMLIVGFGDPLASALAAFVRQSPDREAVVVDDDSRSLAIPRDREDGEAASLIVVLPSRLGERERHHLAALLDEARRTSIAFVGLVGTFRVHLDDSTAEEMEQAALAMVESKLAGARIAVFRPSHVVGVGGEADRWLKRLGPLFPLAPDDLRTCFVEADELLAAIEDEASGSSVDEKSETPGRPLDRRRREYTFLGGNVAWREMLARHRGHSPVHNAATALAHGLSWLLVGRLLAAALATASRWSPTARAWSVSTLKPRTMRELVSLCHRGNIDRVRVVGYNNGVHHFGHRHPGKTIVSTVRLRRTVHARPGVMKADSGATIRRAKDYLGGRGEELYVMPNYSYVALGTAFFVPIHGSAVDYATVADTILRVVLYDPDQDRIIVADRDDAAFRENVYNPRSRAVLLRLCLRTRPRSSYYVRSETTKGLGGRELLAALRDRDAANVEVRQANAASDKVTVSRYYTKATGPSAAALESPRDALGRLWDRLEENPITSYLMHALSRRVAWHTELFLTPAEFERFWTTHDQVPLRKIQLRYIYRDGMPHSPFRDEDCVSADLFLFRLDKPKFDAYMAKHLPNVRFNPGKHSN